MSEPTRQKLTAKGAATRKRLFEAAEEVFGEQGFDAASISEITRRAGVAQGTFYLYFESKQAIFSELVRHIGRDLRHTIAEAVEGLEDRIEVERKGFETFFEYVRRHPNMYRIVRQAEFVDREAFRDYYESIADRYRVGLEKAAARGQIRDLPSEVVAWALMGMGDLLGIRWIILRRDGKVPDEVIDAVMEFIAGGLAAREGSG